MPDAHTETAKTGRLRTLWRFLWKPSARYSLGALLIVGMVVGVVGWGGFNTFMEYTNKESFCISCHVMRDNVYKEYRQTIHYSNRSGVRAICSDCHVPKDWVHKFVRKIYASNELYHWLRGTIDTREKFEAHCLELARQVWTTMKTTDSRECRNCHNSEYMDLTKQGRRARRQHVKGIKAGKTCIDCHKGISHELPNGWNEGANG